MNKASRDAVKSGKGMAQIIRQWIRDGLSPTELIEPSFNKPIRNVGGYSQFRFVPDAKGTRICSGGKCSPK